MSSKSGYTEELAQLILQTKTSQSGYKPLMFRLKDEQQKTAFETLILNRKNLQVFDHIQSQVEELIKCLHPTIVFSPPTELAKAVANQFGDKSSDEYGTWVYYPWIEKLVHILDEQEFTIVRTNRNKYKITAEEQTELATKKIGVMGLSVGQSVSVTLAMERGFGELRIADFDELDLSNINRIRTGVFNLKIKKTVIVAREISEIDPYLNVVCFEEGITEANLNDFLTGNGKLDLLIDECDSFDIKINSRNKAKSLGIPVLMEGSDRGTIDIERFDLEPNRPVLHGMVDHLDMAKYGSLTTMDEKLPYMTAVTGVETLSPRMKGSAVEIMSTISTWPQLASAVTFGGGVTADLARKILLNTLKVSGRYFLDLDELIQNPTSNETNSSSTALADLTLQTIEDFIATNHLSSNTDHLVLTEDILIDLIGAAAKAPSGGNNQPWRWHYQTGLLHLFLEQSATQSYLDPHNISSYVSLGAAIENLLLAAANRGLAVNWELTPQYAPLHIAWFSFSDNHQTNEQEKLLASQINLRHTNRKITPRQELDKAILAQLERVVNQTENAKLSWITDVEKLKELGAISAHADLLRMFVDEAHTDFTQKEMRWDLDEVANTETGIGIHTLDLSNNEQVGLQLIKDKKTIAFLKDIDGGSAFKRLAIQQFLSSSAIGLISMPNANFNELVSSGMAAERLWLAVSSLGLQLHPVNVPLIFFYKNTIEKNLNIPEKDKTILTNLEHNLRDIFSIQKEEQAIFMFRIFQASPSPARTIRKSTKKIFSVGRA